MNKSSSFGCEFNFAKDLIPGECNCLSDLPISTFNTLINFVLIVTLHNVTNFRLILTLYNLINFRQFNMVNHLLNKEVTKGGRSSNSSRKFPAIPEDSQVFGGSEFSVIV